MRYILIIFVFFYISCKDNKTKETTSEVVNLSTKKENLEVKQIVFDEDEFIFIITLSNNETHEFEALEMLFDSSTSFKRVSSDSFKFGNGDHYGNHISMYFDFNINDKLLYLKKLEAFIPFKQDALGRSKYCIMDNLNLDIESIDSEKLFDEFNSNKYCELRK